MKILRLKNKENEVCGVNFELVENFQPYFDNNSKITFTKIEFNQGYIVVRESTEEIFDLLSLLSITDIRL